MGALKNISKVFVVISIILFGAMCAVVGYSYAYMQMGIRYMGFSAPASIAFLYAVPFIAAICILLALAKKFSSKNQ